MAVFYDLYQQDRIFVFVNFARGRSLQQFHEKTVALDPDHSVPCPIPDPGDAYKNSWYTDRPFLCPLSLTYTVVDHGEGGVAGFGGTDVGLGGGAASSSSGTTSTANILFSAILFSSSNPSGNDSQIGNLQQSKS